MLENGQLSTSTHFAGAGDNQVPATGAGTDNESTAAPTTRGTTHQRIDQEVIVDDLLRNIMQLLPLFNDVSCTDRHTVKQPCHPMKLVVHLEQG